VAIIAPSQNDNLVLVVGQTAGGKSASLRELLNPTGVMYFNCESNKKLPFPAKFDQYNITDPLQVYEGFLHAETLPNVHTVVVDSLTFLMDMYESMYVLTAADTMKAWSNFAQYFKNLMQQYVAKSTKNVIFTAHVQSILNETDMVLEKKVPIKGALKANGIEAYFSTIVSARTMTLEKLKPFTNNLLVVTPEDEILGFKYVYQTLLTKETVNERIRASMGMWSRAETFIDNDAQLLMNRLHQYYV
jgi:hypothetical protein